jgi:hypothetical protein
MPKRKIMIPEVIEIANQKSRPQPLRPVTYADLAAVKRGSRVDLSTRQNDKQIATKLSKFKFLMED